MDMDYFQYDEIELSNKRHNMFEDDKNTNFLSNQVNPFYFNWAFRICYMISKQYWVPKI